MQSATIPDPTAIRQRLSDAGLKPTQQRLMIYAAALGMHGHFDAEAVYMGLQADAPSLSRGTVYRTLEAFVEAGLLKQVSTHESHMLFDASLHPHHHLFCETTGEIIDFEDPELSTLIQNYLASKGIDGFEVDDFQLNIFGRRKGMAATAGQAAPHPTV